MLIITIETEDGHNRRKNISECNSSKEFDAILEDIKNISKTTTLISIKRKGSIVNLQSPIIKFLNVEEMLLKIMNLMKYLIFLMK